MHCVSIKFGVELDSSSSFRVQTHRHAKLHMPLISPPTYWLQQATDCFPNTSHILQATEVHTVIVFCMLLHRANSVYNINKIVVYIML